MLLTFDNDPINLYQPLIHQPSYQASEAFGEVANFWPPVGLADFNRVAVVDVDMILRERTREGWQISQHSTHTCLITITS